MHIRLDSRLWALALLLVTGCAAADPGRADTGAPLPANSPAAGPVAAEAYVRTGKAEGGVAVSAVLALPEFFAAQGQSAEGNRLGAESSLLVGLEFETHGGDLMQYDVVRKARLTTDQGREFAPVEWVSLSDDSHHRKGYLRFARQDGLEAISATVPGRLTLELRDLAGVPARAYQWDLPLTGRSG